MPERASARHGERLIGGAITLWMWSVGGRLIVATSALEAERAIVQLLPELSADEQGLARALLDEMRASSAVAA